MSEWGSEKGEKRSEYEKKRNTNLFEENNVYKCEVWMEVLKGRNVNSFADNVK